ncbi:MAG: hypothetical protein AAF799_13925 [Myxococcota bacterium]
MKRLAIRSALRCALPLVVAGPVACSFSFKAGSGSPDDGKPAVASKDDAGDGASAGKPVDGGAAAEPEPEPEPEGRPTGLTDTPAGDPPPPEPAPSSTLAPRKTAVCRIDDATLAAMCQRVLDPIAADDAKAWVAVLHDDVVLTHPSYARGDQRFEGRDAVKDLADKVGGVRTLLHANATDRIVGTVVNDCRNCRNPFVGFQANTRSGTVVVEVALGKPVMVNAVEVSSDLQRPHLREAKPGVATLSTPAKADTPEAKRTPTTETAPAADKKQ